jgi:hypothetical protein
LIKTRKKKIFVRLESFDVKEKLSVKAPESFSKENLNAFKRNLLSLPPESFDNKVPSTKAEYFFSTCTKTAPSSFL